LSGLITSSFQYTEDNIDVVDDWDVTLSEGSSSSLIKVAISGIVTAKGPKECRWAKVEKYFGTEKVAKNRYHGIATTYYNEYGTPGFQKAIKKNTKGTPIILNPIPTDFQISSDVKNGEISYTFNFDNRISKGYHSFDYTINITPSIWKVASSPSINGTWVMLDLGYRTRARFDIHGQFVAGENAVKLQPGAFSKQKYIEYCAPTAKEWYELEEATVLKGANTKVGDNFGYGWSFVGPEAVTKGPKAKQYTIPTKVGLIMKQT
jgi:hypothetical protein